MWSAKCRMPQMQGTRQMKQWEQRGRKAFECEVVFGCSMGLETKNIIGCFL